MKIAVTYDNGNVFQHFGKTESFKVYEVENNQIVKSEVIGSNGTGHGALAGLLADQGIDVLICGGIGGGAQAALAEELHLENKSSISRYESNRSTPTPELFVEMARLFGTTTDYILSGEMPARSSKLMQAEAILQGMKLDKTLDAAITMLMTLKGLEQ